MAAIVAIVMSIAIAMLPSHARHAGERRPRRVSLSAINQAQSRYTQTCGNQRFAPHSDRLGKANPGTPLPYLSPDLTRRRGGQEWLSIQMAGTEPLEAPQRRARARRR